MAFGDFLRSFAENQRRAADERLRQQEYRAQQEDEKRRTNEEMKARIMAVRVITGDIRYKYAIMNTVRAWAYVPCPPGRGGDPNQATDIAIYNIQREAARMGADAVIHAQFHIMRYEIRLQEGPAPAYEVHAFGTAVKITGAPEEWKTPDS
jgi:Putative heavy-metal-binding